MSIQHPWLRPASPPLCMQRCAVCASNICVQCGVTLDEEVREEDAAFGEPVTGHVTKEEKSG